MQDALPLSSQHCCTYGWSLIHLGSTHQKAVSEQGSGGHSPKSGASSTPVVAASCNTTSLQSFCLDTVAGSGEQLSQAGDSFGISSWQHSGWAWSCSKPSQADKTSVASLGNHSKLGSSLIPIHSWWTETDASRLTGSHYVNCKAKDVRNPREFVSGGGRGRLKRGYSQSFPLFFFLFCKKLLHLYWELRDFSLKEKWVISIWPDTACTCESIVLHSADKGLDRCWYECNICCPTTQ